MGKRLQLLLEGRLEANVTVARERWGLRSSHCRAKETSSCRDQEGRRGSEEAVPGPSVVPSGEPGVRGKAGGGARVTAGPKRPHLSVCPGPNFPLQGRQAEIGTLFSHHYVNKFPTFGCSGGMLGSLSGVPYDLQNEALSKADSSLQVRRVFTPSLTHPVTK